MSNRSLNGRLIFMRRSYFDLGFFLVCFLVLSLEVQSSRKWVGTLI